MSHVFTWKMTVVIGISTNFKCWNTDAGGGGQYFRGVYDPEEHHLHMAGSDVCHL